MMIDDMIRDERLQQHINKKTAKYQQCYLEN